MNDIDFTKPPPAQPKPRLLVEFDPGTNQFAVQIDPRMPMGGLVNVLEMVKFQLLSRQLQSQMEQAAREQIVVASGPLPPLKR